MPSTVIVDVIEPQSGTDVTIDGNLIVTGTNNIVPYKIYAAKLTQTGTNDPTAVVLQDTLGDVVLYQRTTTGRYLIQSNAFTNDKTVIIGTQIDYNINTIGFSLMNTPTGVQIFMGTVNAISNYADDLLNGDFIEIRVYP
jgi:hypothetical protein